MFALLYNGFVIQIYDAVDGIDRRLIGDEIKHLIYCIFLRDLDRVSSGVENNVKYV